MANDNLTEYRAKRNFGITNEPAGRESRPLDGALKFCVQHHLARADHYDLRLEWNGVALSWALPKGPSFRTADKRLAMHVEDHPVDYMDFEGIIPKGEYGGGTVMLWDEGEWVPRTDPKKGLAEGSLKFSLKGRRLKGDWALVRMERGEKDAWLLIKERDSFAKSTAGIARYTLGVRSGRSMKEIERAAAQNPFSRVSVMLPQLCEALPSGMGWLYELKYDGYRMLAFAERGQVKLYTRNGRECSTAFSAAAEAVEKMLGGRAAVLDGEMVAAGEGGVPDFGALQAHMKNGREGRLNYVLFDLLALDGEDLRGRPLSERKEKLRFLMKDAPPMLSFSEHTERMTKAGIEAIKSRGVEGIVAKRADSAYSAGKNGDWRKLKFRNAREFVIGGYSLSDEGKLRSLALGFYREGTLEYAGSVGTGFTEEGRREILSELKDLVRKTPPFQRVPKGIHADMVWVKPVLSVQVEYAELTSSGLVRQASFKGIRRDKSAREIDEERPTPSRKVAARPLWGVEITHPEKIMFPRPPITKLAVAEYYAAVAPRMLPYLKDRLLSLVCCPSGIEGESFFRRHLEGDFAGVSRTSPADGEAYFYVTGERGILALAQYNAVEFHVWGSKRSAAERPDVMVFDLDPDEGLPLAEVRRGARELKGVLEDLGLRSFLKTSGGKGYHVVVPLRMGVEREIFRDFAKQVAELMERAHPDRYTANMSKQARRGKIFLDWQRNSPGSTSVAPYSLRARDSAPVSMPIAWEELARVAPNGVTLSSALRRLEKSDPWEDFFHVKREQRLKIKK